MDPTGLFARAVDRALAPRRQRAKSARVVALERELLRSGERMAQCFSGAPSDSWSVLSGAHGSRRDGFSTFSLEKTLRDFEADSDEPVRRTAADIASRLHAVRAHAELGQREQVRALEQALLRLLEAPGLSAAQRRGLLDHLPGALRPLPASLKELFRSQSPVTLYVTMHGPDQEFHYAESPWIELNDIVVSAPLRGLGFGSAALAELCAYADQHRLPIQGDLQPGAGKPEEAVTALAHWYHKRGFRQGDLEPDEWLRLGPIRREPASSAIAPSAERE